MEKATKKASVKKKKLKRNDYIRIAVCCAVVCGFVYTLISQQIRISAIRQETKECLSEIEKQEQKYSQLKEKAKDNSTDKFYEEKARDEGYIRADETQFVVGN